MKRLFILTLMAVLSFAAVPDTDINIGLKAPKFSDNALVFKVIMNHDLPKKNTLYSFTPGEINRSLLVYKYTKQNNDYSLTAAIPK